MSCPYKEETLPFLTERATSFPRITYLTILFQYTLCHAAVISRNCLRYNELEKIVGFDQPYLHVVCIGIVNIRLSTRISFRLLQYIWGVVSDEISYHLCFDLNVIYLS